MAIETLQQTAFETSSAFVAQVNGVVRREARTKSDALNPADPAIDGKRSVYKQVIADPSRYGFVPGLVTSSAWTITYDVWAAEPEHADTQYAILIGVQNLWLTMVGV